MPVSVSVPLLRRDGEVSLTDEQAAQLVRMSAATLERRLAAKWVFEALMHVRAVFPTIGIDSDNGSEFINEHCYRYCLDNKITLTGSRGPALQRRRDQPAPPGALTGHPHPHRPARNPRPGQKPSGPETRHHRHPHRGGFQVRQRSTQLEVMT